MDFTFPDLLRKTVKDTSIEKTHSIKDNRWVSGGEVGGRDE